MTDKKLTDGEIVKACNNCLHYEACKSTYYSAKGDEDILYDFDGEMYANSGCEDFQDKDLINRLQAKAIKEQNKNSKLRNERNRLQAQNKDLAETVHNLTIEKDALFDKAEELKAEIERLKALAENGQVQLTQTIDLYKNLLKLNPKPSKILRRG